MKEIYAPAGSSPLPAVQGQGDASGLSQALDGMLSAARRRWNRARSNVTVQQADRVDNQCLRDAFRVFTDAAGRLEETYAGLRARVDELTGQLARANEELTRQLRDKQALLEQQSVLLATMPAGVILIGADGIVREANAAAKALFGEAVVAKPWTEAASVLVAADSKFEWIVGDDRQRRVVVQEQVIDASGERIVLVHDISEAHAARVAQERNERLASMGEMAARLAHQLRTPLSTAMLYANQLERADLPGEDRAALGQKITARLRSLERVTREMLRFVRGEQSVEQPIQVSTLLGEAAQTIEPIMSARGIRFVCEDHTAGVILHGDRRGLGAALLSLLENAAQATGQGGRVRIAAMGNSVRARIQVSDSGGGIPAHALPHVFEPFYSTRSEGTGLGLAIVKSVVEAHGGSIEVASAEKTGTSFTLTLPCGTEPGAQRAPIPRASASTLREDACLEKEAA